MSHATSSAATLWQVVEGRDGGKVAGFEAYFKSQLHASPLLYDIDFDGIQDILVATYDGEILFFKDTVRWRSGAVHLLRVSCGGGGEVQQAAERKERLFPSSGPVVLTGGPCS